MPHRQAGAWVRGTGVCAVHYEGVPQSSWSHGPPVIGLYNTVTFYWNSSTVRLTCGGGGV